MSGSPVRKEPFIAPFEYFVVENGVSRTYEFLVKEIPNYREVAKSLYWIILTLTPESQKKLENEFVELDKILAMKITVGMNDETRRRFTRIVKNVMAELHENYLTKARAAKPYSGEQPHLG